MSRALPASSGALTREALMFKTLRTIANDLREKSRWCYERDDVPSLVKTVLTDGTTAMILYRLMQASNERGLAPLTMVFNKLNSVVGHILHSSILVPYNGWYDE